MLNATEADLALRNILLIQLVVFAVTRDQQLLVYKKIEELRKRLSHPFHFTKSTGPKVKKDSFWEIDMTNFEP